MTILTLFQQLERRYSAFQILKTTRVTRPNKISAKNLIAVPAVRWLLMGLPAKVQNAIIISLLLAPQQLNQK